MSEITSSLNGVQTTSYGGREVLTVKQLSKYLGISESQVRRLVKSKKIPFLKIMGSYRFFLPIIQKWLCGLTVEPKEESPDDFAQTKSLEIWNSKVGD